MKKNIFYFLILLFSATPVFADDYSGGAVDKQKTFGVSIYGSLPLVDTRPVVDPGIGGGIYFDYRFNTHFSFQAEGFFTTQDGSGASSADGSIEFVGLPVATLKYYILNEAMLDPYIGFGMGLYTLTEGTIDDNSFGMGIGAHVETGLDYKLTDFLVLSAGGTFRSIGIINSFSGANNASAFLPYTLFGRIGYRF